MSEERSVTSLFPRGRKALLCGLAACLAFPSCDDQVAGTSVGTGNPTEIEVAFKDDAGSVAITGTMNVYASTQIPVPGFSPEPLVSVPVNGATHAALNASALKAVADTLWPKASVENGLYRFNVVVTGTDKGSILKGFAFRKDSNDFELRAEDSGAVRIEGVATVMGAMTPLVSFQASLDSARISPSWDYYLFIYGTGYAGMADQGRFSIPKLPQGRYEAHIVLLPAREHSTSGTDSTFVFSLKAPIEPGQDSLALGPILATIPLPDSLKTK
jgi:hypothetical protein